MQTKSFFTKTRWLVTINLLLFFVVNVWADYTVTFNTSGSVGIASGGDYVNSVSTSGYLSVTSDGTSFGSNSQSGSYEMTMTSSGTYIGQIQAAKIVLDDVKKPSSNGGNLQYLITYSGSGSTSGTLSITTDATDYNIALDPTKTIQKIKFYNSGSKKKFTIKGFTVVVGYTITYNCDGEDSGCPSDATHQLALPDPLPSAPTKSGYTFDGWYTNAGKTTDAVAGAAIASNTTLYAKWTADAACSDDVAIGDASLNGSFNLSSVGVQCASITVGSNCAVAANNYGFIWYEGTGNKEINGSGVTRVNNTTAYSSGTFSNTLSSTFDAGTTYTFRAFAINDKPSTAYSAAVSFTPYTVTFNMNGHGSAIAQQVVNSGGTASTPSAPSATGYTFGGWYQEAGCTNSWNFSTTITSGNTTSGNRNLYAKWTAKEYAITLNGNSATSAGSPASVNATYNSSSLSSAITNPSRTGYTFGGWNTKDDGTGLTVINTSGNLVASQSGYTDGSGNWTKDGTAALYAKWTAKSFDVTWMVNGETYSAGGSTSVDFNSHVATLPTAPTPPCGNKFMGWTTTNIGSVGIDKANTSAITALNLFTTAGSAPTITAEGNVTYYAVFADYAE